MLSTKGQRLVLWCGPNQLYSVVIRDRFFMGKKKMDWPSLTFGRIVFDWLFEGRDVTERAEKQHDFLLFVPNGSDLHEEPHRCSCSRGTRPDIQYSAATSAQPHINTHCVHDDTEICSLEKEKKKDSWSFCGPISWSLFWAAFELTAILLTQAVNTFAWQQRESSQLQIRRDGFFFLLTVLLVHENLERVHLVILKRESHFLRGVLVCELAVHEAVKTKRVFNI